MLEISNIEKEYADKVLFKKINLTIYDGEKVGIVGSNGSGKTTLLRIMAGVCKPDFGSVISTDTIGYLQQITEYSENDFIKICTNTETIKEFLKNKNKLHINSTIDFNPERLKSLSGGEKTKLMLASILSTNPKILMLDEPTNHLDQEGVEWLINTLNDYDGTIIVVSHDRYFLNSVVYRIIEIENGNVSDYYGNYDDYYNQKQQQLNEKKQQYAEQVSLEKKINKQIAQLNQWSVKAEKDSRRQGGMMSDSKITGAQTRAQISAAKLAGQAKAKKSHLEQSKENFIEKPYEEHEVFYNIKASMIGSKILINAVDLTKHFGDRILFEQSNFTINAGEKVALIGPNGCGKTTLLKIILGKEDYDGVLWKAPSLKIAYLSQDVLDMNEDITVMQFSQNGDSEYRTKFLTNLVNMNMSKQVFDRKISTLSLGERMRIKMNETILQDFNLLILDEPTNHLDLPNKIFMEKILKNYKGSLILVSHDKTLCQNVCNSKLVFKDKKIIKTE